MVKKIERKVSMERYLVAGIITLLIFSLGITLGFVLDQKRLTWAEEKSSLQKLSYESLQLQYLYLDTLEDNEKSCGVLQTALTNTLIDLGETLNNLEYYRDETKINKNDYNYLLRRFTIDNLKYWLFAKKSKELCDTDNVLILYFFSREDCDICPNQGIILSYFKELFQEDLLIFPIDIDLRDEEPIISLIESVYNIESYPSIVIEDVTHSRVVNKEELGKIICGFYKTPHKSCEKYLK